MQKKPDMELPENWRRWGAKEQSSVNAGYHRAYLNTSRMNHFVAISTLQRDRSNTFKASVLVGEDGNWKSTGSTHETIEGTVDQKETTLDQAREIALEWMESHPCNRDAPRDDIELLSDIISAMREQGIVEQHDTKMGGLIRSGHNDTTSHYIRGFSENGGEYERATTPDEVDAIKLHIGVDGKKSGLSYREYDERVNGETIHKHDPKNQSSLHSNLRKAAESVGLNVIDVADGPHQTHWDYSTGYYIDATIPDDAGVEFEEVPTKSKRRKKRLW